MNHVVRVRAVAVENVDKAAAAGTHHSSEQSASARPARPTARSPSGRSWRPDGYDVVLDYLRGRRLVVTP